MDEDAAEAPSPKVLKPQELLERALKAKAQVKQRLGDLSREHREIETTMRSAPRDRNDGVSKRSRDDHRGRDDGPPPERASKRRTVDTEGAEAGAEEGAGATKMEEAEGNGALPSVGDGKGAERRAARARERGSDSPGSRATPRDPRTKEDAETRQRNRKMFGGLMGHLRASKKDHEVASSGAGHAAVQQKALAKVTLTLSRTVMPCAALFCPVLPCAALRCTVCCTMRYTVCCTMRCTTIRTVQCTASGGDEAQGELAAADGLRAKLRGRQEGPRPAAARPDPWAALAARRAAARGDVGRACGAAHQLHPHRGKAPPLQPRTLAFNPPRSTSPLPPSCMPTPADPRPELRPELRLTPAALPALRATCLPL